MDRRGCGSCPRRNRWVRDLAAAATPDTGRPDDPTVPDSAPALNLVDSGDYLYFLSAGLSPSKASAKYGRSAFPVAASSIDPRIEDSVIVHTHESFLFRPRRFGRLPFRHSRVQRGEIEVREAFGSPSRICSRGRPSLQKRGERLPLPA